jgi:hypothetical protein
MYLKWGTVGEREEGMGRKGGGVSIQPTRDQSGRVQVRKRGVQGIRVGISKQKGIIQRIGACTSVDHDNHVYIVLIKDCV